MTSNTPTSAVPSNARTTWAERHVADFLSIPLIREFVYRSPQAVRGGTQKEVADFFITSDAISLLISQKCQEDPESRDLKQTEKWSRKKAEEAANQLRGALRTSDTMEIWCNHPRRGKQVFPKGLPKIDHGIVLIEARQLVELVESKPGSLPLEAKGTPIHYFTLNDFMNLADQLRTLPELEAYLKARTVFPPKELLTIGHEEDFFSLYLLNGGTFGNCASRSDARTQLALHNAELIQIIQQKKDAEQHCLLMEKVADFLATRNPNVPADLQGQYEPLANRVGYLKMQALLANMQFRDRACLGRSFSEIIDSMRQRQKGFACVANAVDYLPNTVFVFGSSKQWDQREIVKLFPLFTQSAMAHYSRTECLMVVDRDGENFEVCLVKAPSVPTDPKVVEFGRKTFGKITSRPIDFHG